MSNPILDFGGTKIDILAELAKRGDYPVTNVKSFGAKGDGVTDDTAAIQSAIDSIKSTGGMLRFPTGTYQLSSALQVTGDNIIFQGDGMSETILNLTSTTASVIVNPDSATTARLFCSLRDLKLTSAANNPAYPVIDGTSLQFLSLHHVWIAGGGASAIGVSLHGVVGATEGTYGLIDDCYIGLIGTGVRFGAVGNSCYVRNTRIQPLAGGWGLYITGDGGVSANNIIADGVAIEYPGQVSSGIFVDAGVDGVTIIGPRFESLATGIQIAASATDTTIIGAYYSSCTTNVTDAGTNTAQLSNGLLALGGAQITLSGGDLALNTALQLGAETDANITNGGDKILYNSTQGEVQLRSFRATPIWAWYFYNGTWQNAGRIQNGGDHAFPSLKGPILIDRTTSTLYRLKVTNGTLGVEPA